MTSIMTNAAAMAALQTLRSINRNLDETQSRVSSGYRVETAADNAAYWSIATTMRSDNAALSTVQDALGLGAAKVDTAYAALDTVIDLMSEVKAKLVAAREPGVDKTKIDKELSQLKEQLVSAAQSASFSGENWLYNDAATAVGTKSIVASFNRSADGSVSVTTLDYDTSGSILVDVQDASRGLLTMAVDADALVSAPTGTPREYYLIDASSPPAGTEIALSGSTTDEELDDMISVVDDLISQLTNSAATLGAITSRIEMQENFVANLMDVIDKGVGRLVDADMNEESTRMKALQTQQQLGIQSLSIANTNSENILRLFQE
ncbi:flagellin [Sinorhizobium fredii USDA 205]|uniref:Flagellin n=1 Tax=Rhizobium fredii TaxID=380 RepID=A0A844AGA9_RHIFR|nr:flagellin [Sinorhizobium fredii]AWM23627.1 Flagellin protein FlaA [Sinorhizobium fredii CCBAU 25509]KSV87285.1 flagellin [Sinorhizobium fredii USDA 205]MQW94813.1 flagellin [Sinorhizobium fredii]MQX11411.1 flagellin [Sinorhizobium fredii]UTY48169.1 flagellin [Sinorhizobium fredii]